MAAKRCLMCSGHFKGRADAKTCSPRCRKRLQQVRFSLTHSERRRRGRANKIIALVLLGLFGLFSIFFSAAPPTAHALTPSNDLNFQGRLLNAAGAVVPDGNYNIDFKLYNADSTTGTVGTCTGACLWEETYLVASSQGVSVTNGYFSVNLNSLNNNWSNAVNWDQQYYLTMNVTTNGTTSCTPRTSCTWNGEMQNATHSIALTSVPLAFRANQLGVAGTNEQVLQFASTTFGQTTTISVQDPGATTANLCFETVGGATAHTCAAATGGSGYIQNSTGGPQSANFNIISAATGSIGGIIHANAGQTVDIFDVNDSGSNVYLGVSSNGSLTSSPATTGTITLGTATQTGTITIGQATTATTQAVNIESANGTASTQTVTIGGGSSTTSGGKVVNLATGAAGTGTTNTVHIADTTPTGTGTNAVTVGTNTNASTVSILGGTGTGTGSAGIKLQPATAGDVFIGNTGGTGTIIIGSSTGNNPVQIANGSGASAVSIANVQNGGSVSVGAGFTTGTFSVGGTATTGAITIGQATTATTASVSILSANGTASTQTINIGAGTSTTSGGKVVNIATGAAGTGTTNTVHIADTSPTGTGTNAVTIGSNSVANNVTIIQGGVNGANETLQLQVAASGVLGIGTANTTKTIDVGSVGSTAAASTIKIANTTDGTNTQSVSIGSNANVNDVVNLDAGNTGGINIGTTTSAHTISIGTGGTNTQAINIGSVNGSSAVQIFGGTTGTTISLQAGTGGTIAIGSANGNTVNIGGNVSNTPVNITSGGTGNISLTSNSSTTGTTIKSGTNSTTALLVQNSSSQNVLGIDTVNSTNTSTTNLVNNPSIESAPSASDWVLKGTATVAQDATTAYVGANSIKVTGVATNDGAFAKLNSTLSAGNIINITFYAKSNSAATTATIQAGYSINATAETVLCTNTAVINNNGWTKYTCSLTVSGVPTASNAIFIKTTDATARTINIDGAVAQLNATTNNASYREGVISLQGSINSPLLLQDTDNTTNALAVQNASGNTIFNVDTTDTNLISNPGFEVGLAGGSGTGWTAFAGTGTGTISRDTTKSYLGVASLKVNMAGAGTGGAQLNLNPVVTAISQTYTISFFALLGSTAPTFQVTYDSTGSNPLTCNPTGTPVTGGWTRFSCSIAANATAPTTGGFVRIAQTNSAISNWYIDAVQMEQAASASAYGAGAISLNGVIQSPVVFKNNSDSTSEFQIQNAAGTTTLLNVDSLNSVISVGGKEDINGSLALKRNATDYTGAGGNDINFGADASFVRLNPSGPISINSIATPTPRDGLVLTLTNVSANVVTITNNGGGTAGNQILTGAGSITLNQNGTITLIYDSSSTRWRVIGDTNGNGASGVTLQSAYTNSSPATITTTAGKGITFAAGSGADNTSLFQVQNAAGTALLNVDSTYDSTNLITNGGFETNTTGWANKGTATNFGRSTAFSLYGGASLKFTTTGTSGTDGAKYNITLTNGTIYILSFCAYDATDSTSSFQVGYAFNGANEATFNSGNVAITNSGWSCGVYEFTASGVTGTPYIFLMSTSGTVGRDIYLDGISLKTESVIATGKAPAYQEGTLNLGVPVVSPLQIQTTNNSTSAFSVNNNIGNRVFTVDTTNSRVGIGGLTTPDATLDVRSTTTRAFAVQNGTASDLLVADTSNMRISVGTLGTATGQLYVSGSLPSSPVFTTSTNLDNIGDVFVQGRYAYVTSFNGSKLFIYDVSNPASTTVVNGASGTTLTGVTNAGGISVQGHYAYILSYGSSNLSVYDVSNPSSPTFISKVSTGTNPFGLTVSGRYAYLTAYTSGQLQIFDISNPSNLINVSTTSTTNSFPCAVRVQGNYAYVTVGGSGSAFMQIFNVANPASPSSVSNTNVGSGSACTGAAADNSAMFVQGRYAYYPFQSANQVKVYDVSNPASPSVAATISTGTAPNGVFVQNRYLYVTARSSNRVEVYDISNLSSVASIGNISVSNVTSTLFVQGRYLYVGVTVGTPNTAFDIFDMGGEYAQQFEAGGAEVGTLTVDNNSMFAGDVNIQGGTTIGQSLQVNGNVGVSGQLYVSGSVPTGAVAVLSSTGSNDLAIAGNYAYAPDFAGHVKVIDISNPSTPAIISTLNLGTPTGSFRSETVYVQGKYLYVGTWDAAFAGYLQIADISNPANPVLISTFSPNSIGSPDGLYVSGRYAYMTDGNPPNKLHIIDISNPLSPLEVFTSATNAYGLHLNSVYVQGRYAYVQSDTGISVIDISNPSSPVVMTNQFGIGGTNLSTGDLPARSLFVQGRYIYTMIQAGADAFKIIDAKNPSSLSIVGTMSLTVGSDPMSVYVQGRYAYLGNDTNSTITTIDVSNPAVPVSVGTFTGPGNAVFNLIAQGRYLYVASFGASKLGVYDLGGAYVQQLEAGGAELGTLTVDSNSLFGGDAVIQGGLAVSGAATFQSPINVSPSGDSTSALLIGDKRGSTVVNVSAISTDNLLVNGNFEEVGGTTNNTNGWLKYTAPTNTETQFLTAATNPTYGARTLQVTTTTGNTQGAQYPYQFKANTTYTFSLYASLSSNNSGVTTGAAVFGIGAKVNGSDVTCSNGNANGTTATNTLTLTTTPTWYICTFTTTTVGTADFLYVRKNTDANIRSIHIDGAMLEYGSNASTVYSDPGYIFNNLILNPSFENAGSAWSSGNVTNNGWTLRSGTGAASQSLGTSNDFAQFGQTSMKLVTGTSTAVGNGVQQVQPFLPNTQYSFSFWARANSSTGATMQIGNSNNGTDAICLNSQTFTTAWTQFSCTFTTGATIVTADNIFIKQNDLTSDTIYLDGITLTQAPVPLSYTPTADNIDVDSLLNNITLNAGNYGEIQPWKASFNTNNSHGAAVTCVLNGYVYILDSGSPEYGKLNPDGPISSWSAIPQTPNNKDSASCVAYNGYLYKIGGGNPAVAPIYYARPSASDGSITGWTTSNTSLPVGLRFSGAVVANGYLYVVGGNSTGAAVNSVYYAKVNADGSLAPFITSSNNLNTSVEMPGVVAFSGYLWSIGGANGGTGQTIVQCAAINSDGSTGTWNSCGALPAGRVPYQAVVVNGYAYIVGGGTSTSTTTGTSTVLYAKLNGNGTTGAWQTSAYPLPSGRSFMATVTANGYIYTLNGNVAPGGSSTTAVYYTSTSRILANSSIDLVGFNATDYDNEFDGSTGSLGGSITAGNITGIGNLQIQGTGTFVQGLNTGSNLVVGGDSSLQGNAGVGTRYGSRVFSDNFESGGFKLWNNGTSGSVTADTTTVHNGKYAAKINEAANFSAAYNNLPGTSSTIYMRMWVYATTIGGSLNNYFADVEGTTSGVKLYYDTAGKICVWDLTTGTSAGCTASAVGTGSWHQVEMRTTSGGVGVGIISLTVDGTQVFSNNSINNGSGNYLSADIGDIDGLATYNISIDDVSVDTASNGNASSLNVDDSLHVGGSSTFGSSVLVQTASNTSNAFQIQNSSGSSLISVDTTTTNLVTNGDFETNTTGWSLRGSATIAQKTVRGQYGDASLNISTTAINGGAQYTFANTLAVGTYSIGISVRLAPGATVFASNGLTFGILNNGGASENPCSNLSPSVTANTNQAIYSVPSVTEWTRFTCTVTISSTVGTSFYVKQLVDSTARSFYIDAVDVESGGNGPGAYSNGTISLSGQIVSPMNIVGTVTIGQAVNGWGNNSQAALTTSTTGGSLPLSTAYWYRVQAVFESGPGIAIYTSPNTITTGGSTSTNSNTINWAKKPTGAVGYIIWRATTNPFTNLHTPVWSSKEVTNGNATSYTDTTNTGWVSSCTVSTCEDSTGDLSSTDSSSLNIALGSKINVGDVAIWQDFATGDFTIDQEDGGIIQLISEGYTYTQSFGSGPYQIQNASGTNMLTVQTGSGGTQVFIGAGSTGENTPILLTLDNQTGSSSDPGGVVGGMYYNVTIGTFRCYQGSAWRNCLGGGPSNQSTATQGPFTAGTDTYITNSNIPLPTGGFRGPTGSAQDGTKITWHLVLTKTAAGTGASSFSIRVGTNGTTADTLRCTAFSTGTPTAVADVAVVDITVYATAGGSGTTLNCSATLTHVLATTGWNNANYAVQAYSTQTSFDSTPANTKIGLSLNAGTATSVTLQSVSVTTSNL